MSAMLTEKQIAGHPELAGMRRDAELMSAMIYGRICSPHRSGALGVLGRLMNAQHPHDFRYMEIGILHGGTLAFMTKYVGAGLYCGVDCFHFRGHTQDNTSGCRLGADVADRNVRYFGGGWPFAIFEGDSQDPATMGRVLLFMDSAHLLFLDADHETESVRMDLTLWAGRVAPGGILAIDDYGNPRSPGVQDVVDDMDKTGWDVIGPLECARCNDGATIFVMQRHE